MSEQPARMATITGGQQQSGTLLLALGNPLRGDDGIGAAVLEQVAQAATLPGGVTVLDGGTPGLETALLLEGYARAIIIDAAEMGDAPGMWRRFTPDTVQLRSSGLRGTLHDAGLAEAVALGKALGILPSTLIIYGVQPAAIGWEPGLSAPVQTAIPALCASILADLRSN